MLHHEFSTSELLRQLSVPGIHEKNIREIFPKNAHYDLEAPTFDKPLYIMAFTNRSGSNLLADYLRQTDKFTGFREALNWEEVNLSVSKTETASLPDYIKNISRSAPQHTLWGVKASWDQMAMLVRTNIISMFPSVRVVHTVRADLIGQAISHWIAHQTGKWTSRHSGSNTQPTFNNTAIERILSDIQMANCYIDCICRAMGWPRISVVYEHLQADPKLVMSRIAKFSSIDLDDWLPEQPSISRQRDNINDDFREMCFKHWRAALTGIIPT